MATVAQRWVGVDALTVKVASSTGNHRVAFSTQPSMTTPVFSNSAVPDAQGVSRHSFPSLAVNTLYYYRVEDGGTLIDSVQSFRTLPATTAETSFSFAFVSCRHQTTGTPDPPILANLVARNPTLFIQTGDFHYANISTNNQTSFRNAYDELFTRTNIISALSGIPTAYVWSDADFGGNGSDSTSAARPAAVSVYRERVPHTTLPDSAGGIYHTFRVGRVRFIVLDTRSYRSPSANTDNASKTMLGTEQKAWLRPLLAAADTPLTFIVSPEDWVGTANGNDHWGAYQTERTEVAGWITAAVATKVVFLCGDSHGLGIDDGTNAAAGCHAWTASPLNHSNLVMLGGPYSGGSYTGGPGYGLVTVTDTNDQITATFQGIKADGSPWASDSVATTRVSDSWRDLRAILGDAGISTSSQPVNPWWPAGLHNTEGAG